MILVGGLAQSNPLRLTPEETVERGPHLDAIYHPEGKFELSASDGADHQKRLGSIGDRLRQRIVRRFVGEILGAGEEPNERTALLRHVVAHGSAQRRVAGLQRVQHGALRHDALNNESHFAFHFRQRS
jgi:hypothetical protein